MLTRSALETLRERDILESVRTHFTLLAPHSLLLALERELLDADEKCAPGQHTLWSDETGLRADEVPAGDPSLLAKAERARALLGWVRPKVRAEFRPLETIHAPDSEKEEARQTIGSDSMDAVQLTQHFGTVLLADDLGLRRFLPKGGPARTVSTVALLSILAERGAFTATERDRMLLRLVERRYTPLFPHEVCSLHRSIPRTAPPRSHALRSPCSAGPVLDLPDAAAIAANVLRDIAVAPLQLAGIAHVVALALDGLAQRWPVQACGLALSKAPRPSSPSCRRS